LALWAWVLSLALSAAQASAQSSDAPVSISVAPCVPVDHSALYRLLAIELGTSTAREPGPKVPTRVWVSCSPAGIELRLEDGMTSKVMERTLPASSFRDASSTRLLALAVAEFVVASWIELRQPPPSVKPVPVAPPPSPQMRAQVGSVVSEHAAEPSEPEEIAISGALAIALWTSTDSLWLGGGARITRPASPLLAWLIALDLSGTSAEVDYGEVHGFSGSLAFAALFYLKLPSLMLLSGPGARVGVTRLAGQPNSHSDTKGKNFAAPYGGPLWQARADLLLGRQVRLGVEVEAGYITLPAKATISLPTDAKHVFGLEGFWISPALSLGATF
jgi:hypothetical protein